MGKTAATIYFGSELRRAREAAAIPREEFGKLVNYTPSTLGAFETGDRFPSLSLATDADKLLNTGGQFGATPAFRAFLDRAAHGTFSRH